VTGKKVTFGLPHIEWDQQADKFSKKLPAPPPIINVKATILRNVHERYGFRIKKNAHSKMVEAVADTGCQRTTGGIDILRKLKISRRSLVPTTHRIVGITDTRLNVIGSLFLNIAHNGRTTNQMVHICDNSSGLYLSEAACRDLEIVDSDFPHHSVSAPAKMHEEEDDEKCNCVPRTETPERPTEIPFTPTLKNREALKDWLISKFKSTCSHQPLKQMTGKPMDIKLKLTAEPHKVHTPIEIPHHCKKKVKADIERDVRLGIIEPVPQGTPTTWCSRMVVASKKNVDPRRTVNLQKLNDATLRETHHTSTPFNIVSVTPKNTYKTTCDAWNGYHSLPITEESKDATTFITEWGRYRYCRAPQGFHGSGDAYTRRFDDITANTPRVSRCIDDSLLWDYGIEDAFWHTFDYLKHCSDNGIVFNVDKFIFAQETCEFAGFELTPDDYRPPKRVLDSILKFPTPKSVTDIRSWFGLINQVAYAFSQSAVMAPFRDLLSKKKHTKFYWDEELDRTFEKSKETIVNLIKDGVCSFELDRVTCLSTDWSKTGIGYTLCQKHCRCPADAQTKTFTPNCGKGHWKHVLADSRFTTPAESRYTPIEGEALGVAYGLQQCRKFVLGCPKLIVAVDHKPLTKILNQRPLESIENPRLLRIKEKTLMYDFNIIHIPGESNMAPDAASRYPSKSSHAQCPMVWEDDHCDTEEIEEFAKAHAATHATNLPGILTWELIKKESALDEECAQLKEVITSGFPKSRDEMPNNLQYYYPLRDELYTVDEVVFKGKKMLIPTKLRAAVLEGLHAAHQGVSSMRANARDRLFWPGMDGDLKQIRNQCKRCNENAPSQPSETLIITPPPDLPFQQVVTDFYQANGCQYIIYADRYTGWTEVAKVSSTSFTAFKKCVIPWFRTYGVPKEISSDGGPPFNSHEYRIFLQDWGIKSRLSSAHYAQSNGRAEIAVKTMKRALLGNADPRTGEINTDSAVKAMMSHRNTPNQDTGISPAEMLYGYKLRDHLPNHYRSIRKEWKDVQNAKELSFSIKDKQSSTGTHLPVLQVGDHVSLQNQYGNQPGKWSNTGIIVEVHPNHQYGVMLDGSRRTTLRNRKFLRKLQTKCQIRQIHKYNVPATDADFRPAPPENTSNSTAEAEQNPNCSTPRQDITTVPSTLTTIQLSPIPMDATPTTDLQTSLQERAQMQQTPTTSQVETTPEGTAPQTTSRRPIRTITKPKRLLEEWYNYYK
jgi:hypothetical protein